MAPDYLRSILGMRRRHCIMHVLNLGLLHVILAEGLLLLAEDLQLRHGSL